MNKKIYSNSCSMDHVIIKTLSFEKDSGRSQAKLGQIRKN